jgi:hypothetical protein
MTQLGRIGGGVLEQNLERQGVNLSFKNLIADDPLLFLEVSSNNASAHQVGINTDILPEGRVLTIKTKIKTDSLITESLSVPNYLVDQNRFQVESGNINLNSGELIQASGIATYDLTIQNNIVSSKNNKNINLEPATNGTVDIYSDLSITENLFASENINIEGSIIFGDSTTDTVVFDSEISSDLIPKDNNKEIGSASKRWKNLHNTSSFLNNLISGDLITSDLIVDRISLSSNNIFINDGASDLELNNFSSNLIKINNLNYFENNNILNSSVDLALNWANTSNGYLKFDGTFGLVLPVIAESDKSNNPVIGETVYNNDIDLVEIWNGSIWVPVAGTSPTVSPEEFEDITNEWSLILG